MNQAYLVLGPESSGTRLVTKLLIDAGCFGDGGHEQRLDKEGDATKSLIEEARLPQDGPVVWRRSYPHGGSWVDISKAVVQLRRHGYKVTAVITTRDWFPMIRSQIKEHSGHVNRYDTGEQNAQKAYRKIFADLPADVPFVMASYDSIGRFGRRAVRRLLERLGLRKPRLVSVIKDGNCKWYREYVTDE